MAVIFDEALLYYDEFCNVRKYVLGAKIQTILMIKTYSFVVIFQKNWRIRLISISYLLATKVSLGDDVAYVSTIQSSRSIVVILLSSLSRVIPRRETTIRCENSSYFQTFKIDKCWLTSFEYIKTILSPGSRKSVIQDDPEVYPRRQFRCGVVQSDPQRWPT